MHPPRRADDALFLDFDGTLVELAGRPSLVRVPRRLPALLAAVAAARDGALAIVSGRSLASIDAALAPMRFAGAGLHGLELRGEPDTPAPAEEPLLAPVAQRLAASLRAEDGMWLEDKGKTLALHYRDVSGQAEAAERLLREAVAGTGLAVIAGKRVFEARPHGVDKGQALRTLMLRPPFSGRRPVFVGDDVTDEDGIAAAQGLGGIGIKVGDGASAAVCRLEHPAAVRAWLAACVTSDATTGFPPARE